MDFHQVNVFLEAEKVQCHLKPEHPLHSPMKLDKNNDAAAYGIPIVWHLCTIFTQKQNIARD